MILLFTAIFSTISIIEDRREGFLQGVLVSPAPRSAIVMGKILGGTLLATGQGLVFLLLTPFLSLHMGLIDVVYVVAIMFLVSFGLTGLGFIIAWRLDSTQGFHAIMNLFLMPMWFLSGALFPASGAPAWLQAVMAVNPLTYGVAALHQGFFHGAGQPATQFPSAVFCLLITTAFSLLMFGLSVHAASAVEKPA
jgi:ABC-2 type transport system permease protein